MKYIDRLKNPTNTNDLENRRALFELDKFLTDKGYELADVNINLEKAKNKNPISIGEILGLMNKKDLILRSIKQAEELEAELFG